MRLYSEWFLGQPMHLERLFPSVLAAVNIAERGRCYAGLDDQGSAGVFGAQRASN